MFSIFDKEPTPEQSAARRQAIKRSTPDHIVNSVVSAVDKLVALINLTKYPNPDIMDPAVVKAVREKIDEELAAKGLAALYGKEATEGLIESIGGLMGFATETIVKNKDAIWNNNLRFRPDFGMHPMIDNLPSADAKLPLRQIVLMLNNFWADREFDTEIDREVNARAQELMSAFLNLKVEDQAGLLADTRVIRITEPDSFKLLGLGHTDHPDKPIYLSV